jgi:hypothetical protein
MTDKINLYINSSYRKKDETTSYLKCIVPSGLIKSYGKDYLTLSVTSFYCFNTLYQMDETNNEFSLIIRNSDGDIHQLLFYSLDNCVGNPNVYDIRNELNELLNGYISITYDKIKNLFVFTRTKAHDTDNDKLYLKIKTCGTFLGFSKDYNNKEIEITTDGVYSYQPINVIYHQQLLINIDGDIQLPINNLDNKNSDVLEPSSVLFTKPIDIQKNQLIMYDNGDGNASFQYKISQKDTINQINIRITNQDNEDISTLEDWNLTLQFERHDEDMTESILNQIKEYIKYIFIVLGEYITRR